MRPLKSELQSSYSIPHGLGFVTGVLICPVLPGIRVRPQHSRGYPQWSSREPRVLRWEQACGKPWWLLGAQVGMWTTRPHIWYSCEPSILIPKSLPCWCHDKEIHLYHKGLCISHQGLLSWYTVLNSQWPKPTTFSYDATTSMGVHIHFSCWSILFYFNLSLLIIPQCEQGSSQHFFSKALFHGTVVGREVQATPQESREMKSFSVSWKWV